MGLTVLSVAYPFAPVSRDSSGGAEQVLAVLDHALVEAGHRSLVLARAGSRVAGTLLPISPEQGEIDQSARAHAHAAYREILSGDVVRNQVDVVHLHGLDFHSYLPEPGPPALVTLHLPIAWYPPRAFEERRPRTFFNCVSAAQHSEAMIAGLLPPIENGVDVDIGNVGCARLRFALMLARICPEKGIHLALEAAKRAGAQLLIAGEIYPYAEHRRYFEREVATRLDKLRRYIGPVGLLRKRRLLTTARCVIVASAAPETSSLVAREALAAGTPVIALARGALVDVVEHGRTGFLVDNVGEMAAAIAKTGEINPDICRFTAQRRFSATRMIAEYFQLYHALVDSRIRFGDAA